MRQVRPWRSALALIVVLALAIAGCGDGESTDTSADDTTTTTAAATTTAGEATTTTAMETTTTADAMAEVAAFYSENPIRVVSGGGPGGGAYAYTELVGRYIGKYIPGNPEVVVEARPGAGTMINANEIANTEPNDGTVFGTIHANMIIAEALQDEQARFSFLDYGVIGAVDNAYLACGAHSRSGITDVQQLIDGETLTVGASRPGAGNHDTPAALNAAIGTNFDIITGYDAGGGPILLAIERNEVDGGCGTASTFEVAFRDLIDAGDMTVLVTIGDIPSDNPILANSKRAEDLVSNDADRALLDLVSAPAAVAWPFVMPPGVPQERLDAVREAFIQTLNDEEFLAAAEQANLVISPRTYQDVLDVVDRVLATDQDVLDRFSRISAGEAG
jgi:tripartite-type tricarboxylate transporter receptor subunit TctC